MRKVKFFASLTALMTLSVAALTACTTAEASTHHTVSQTGGESVHSSRLDAILERGYIEVATDPEAQKEQLRQKLADATDTKGLPVPINSFKATIAEINKALMA